jgi:predicted CXXCH cytochrome family protein
MRSTSALFVLALVAAALPAGAAQPTKAKAKDAGAASAAPAKPFAAVFKLKPGADGKLCLDCHGNFNEILKKSSVHTPVRARQCVGCHSPHASSHGKLLAADRGAICISCHARVVPATAKSAHAPVAAGRCVECHDPHASGFKNNLVKGGNDLCATCHKPLVDHAAKARIKHRPLEKDGCASCHDAHGSATAVTLLKKDVPELCVGCHKADGAIFLKKHSGYPVGSARCTSCHDPHGSDKAGMLYDKVHAPVAKGMCAQCHEAPGSAERFKTKTEGVALCKLCHAQQVAAMLDKGRLHWPAVEGKACLTCHSPHASKQAKLVKGDLKNVCGRCHADTIKRQELSPTKHDPIRDGDCGACHDPHGSDVPLLLVNGTGVELCGKCHDWQRHSSHPIGDKFKDPRNKNLALECLSCHRAHGTEYKHMMPYPKQTDLCVKCHEKYKR